MSSHLSPLFILQSPESVTAADQESSELRLRKLPRRLQQVFLLSRLDALPYADIAGHLELSVTSVEKDMVRVLRGPGRRAANDR